MNTAAFDLDELIDRLGGDREAAAELIGIFLEDSAARLEQLRQPAGDLDALRRTAHTLKGASGNMAAHAASAVAAALEAAAASGDVAAADAARVLLLAEMERLFAVLRGVANGMAP